jgi:hypothetical protein
MRVGAGRTQIAELAKLLQINASEAEQVSFLLLLFVCLFLYSRRRHTVEAVEAPCPLLARHGAS